MPSRLVLRNRSNVDRLRRNGVEPRFVGCHLESWGGALVAALSDGRLVSLAQDEGPWTGQPAPDFTGEVTAAYFLRKDVFARVVRGNLGSHLEIWRGTLDFSLAIDVSAAPSPEASVALLDGGSRVVFLDDIGILQVANIDTGEITPVGPCDGPQRQYFATSGDGRWLVLASSDPGRGGAPAPMQVPKVNLSLFSISAAGVPSKRGWGATGGCMSGRPAVLPEHGVFFLPIQDLAMRVSGLGRNSIASSGGILLGEGKTVCRLALSPNDPQLLAGVDSDGFLCLLDARESRIIDRQLASGVAREITWSKDGQGLVLVNSDGAELTFFEVAGRGRADG